MSPSENDLRAALRHGEGDAPDPHTASAAARSYRGRRRTRVLSVAGVAVLVVAAAVVPAVLSTRGDAPTTPAAGPVVAPASGPSAATSSAPGVTCPPKPPTNGSDWGPRWLFDGNRVVRTVTVCTYSTDSGAGGLPPQRNRFVLTGADAAAVARSLQQARTVPDHRVCPAIAITGQHEAALLAGSHVAAVVGNLDICPMVSDGSPGQYAWQPPAALTQRLEEVDGRPFMSSPSLHISPATH